MIKRKRRNHSPRFKAKAAVAAIRGDRTVADIAAEYDVHPNQIHEWKKRLLSEAEQLFDKSNKRAGFGDEKVQELHAKIGELMMERDSLRKTLNQDR